MEGNEDSYGVHACDTDIMCDSLFWLMIISERSRVWHSPVQKAEQDA